MDEDKKPRRVVGRPIPEDDEDEEPRPRKRRRRIEEDEDEEPRRRRRPRDDGRNDPFEVLACLIGGIGAATILFPCVSLVTCPIAVVFGTIAIYRKSAASGKMSMGGVLGITLGIVGFILCCMFFIGRFAGR